LFYVSFAGLAIGRGLERTGLGLGLVTADLDLTLYLHTFVLSIPYPPLNATYNSISSSLYRLVILCQRLRSVLTIFGAV